uniref:Coiled-coil domain containing 3a n=1 Tax=Sinocyclocheilus rhinocerous TaxID=307959 RepID=A0A673K4D1_9TELE
MKQGEAESRRSETRRLNERDTRLESSGAFIMPQSSASTPSGRAMDENYNILPHGVNFQDAIFPDTLENRRLFSSLFQFSNCTDGQTIHNFNSDWESQEDSRLLCSSVQKVLFEEEERVGQLEERVAELERKNEQLKERVGKLRHSLRKARKVSRRAERERQELQERLKTAERRVGHHINAISPQHSPPRHRYTHGL